MEFRLQAECIAFERFRLKAELHALNDFLRTRQTR